MSTIQESPRKLSPAQEFGGKTKAIATRMLTEWVGEARAKEATGRIATALSASAAAARDPSDFYACTPASIAKVIAISALTGIMVSTGQAALAYAIPRRPRKDDPPQLQYQLSHRGIAVLAKRAGFALIAIPISVNDKIAIDKNSEVVVKERDFDNPPANDQELRGVLVIVKSIETGVCISKGFVAKAIIDKRRDSSDSYCYAEKSGKDWAKDNSPWHKWYVEMAMKTAMHYAINRGWCVVDDTEAVRALSADAEGDSPIVSVGIDEPRTSSLTDRLIGQTVEAETFQASSDEALASSPQDA